MHPSLRLGKASATTEIEIRDGEQVLGRSDDADHVLAEDFVSGQHAKLNWHNGQLAILDLDSTNGTFVNGAPVVGWTSLADGDLVRFAGLEATVRIPLVSPKPEPTRQMLRPPLSAELRSADPPTPPSTPAIPPPAPNRADSAASITPSPPSPRRRSRPSRAVFVSYASEDSAVADSLCRYFDRAGWEVWRDADVLKGGDNWSAEIAEGLRNADAMIVLITDASMTSRWVRREIRAADRAGLPILPVRLGQPPIPDELALIINELHQVTLNEFETSALPAIEDDLVSLLDRSRSPDGGRTQIMVGNVLSVIGIIGIIVAFGMFFYFGYQAIVTSSDVGFDSSTSFDDARAQFDQDRRESDAAFLRVAAAFPVFFVSGILAAIGEGMKRSGRRKQI